MKFYLVIAILLSSKLFAEDMKDSTLWISTKTQFGYNTTFIRFPSLESCQASLIERKKKLIPDTEIWCR